MGEAIRMCSTAMANRLVNQARKTKRPANASSGPARRHLSTGPSTSPGPHRRPPPNNNSTGTATSSGPGRQPPSSGPSTFSSGPPASISGSATASSGQAGLFPLFYGSAKASPTSSAPALTASAKRKRSNDCQPIKKKKERNRSLCFVIISQHLSSQFLEHLNVFVVN